jgi:hypothetical protein
MKLSAATSWYSASSDRSERKQCGDTLDHPAKPAAFIVRQRPAPAPGRLAVAKPLL